MKIVFKKKFVLVVIFLLASHIRGQVKIAEKGNYFKSIALKAKEAELLFEQVKVFPNESEFSIAIIEKGKTKFVGLKRVNDTIIQVENSKKVFEIGSISKVFTATLLTNFVQENRLELTADVQKYLGFNIRTDQKITFKELVNHTSGLPRLPSNLNLLVVDKKNPYKNYDLEKLKQYLTQEVKLKQKPGAKYGYSNLGAGLLGFILEEVSKSNYETLVQEKIFSKYKMTSSTTDRKIVKDKLVKGLNKLGKETQNWDMNVLVGAGGILSSVNDLAKFGKAQFKKENKELKLTQQPTFKINENMAIGLGWHIITNRKGEDFIWHNGGTGGYSSSMALDVDGENGVIILSNVSAFHRQKKNIDKLCLGLVKALNE
ncbi:serine hydrolase domain-containing protein [Tenacibaculum caenipelagi]|uniref:Beta-lactamase n=1 Tax=Tenacibaculum caenipelagi TaxID=1325435 RepID=A0A4R6THY6_9FLAO|nr:serine hydrolase domain-containing protein [Tenacibaculum caenipelagi]TDQ29701.1 CubicO group peptidase (beta-lactamase class C family) [Tenacibaculum caenipelagi]